MSILHIREVLKKYISNNYKEYILVSILFLIGVFAGVLIINNCKENQISEIRVYLSDFITKIKSAEKIDKNSLILSSIKNNIILTVILWVSRNYSYRNTNSFIYNHI